MQNQPPIFNTLKNDSTWTQILLNYFGPFFPLILILFPFFHFFIFIISSITNAHLSSPSSQTLTRDLRPLPDYFLVIWNTTWDSSLLFWFTFQYDTLFLFSLLSFFPFFISLDSFYLLGNHRFSFFFFFQFSNRRKKQYPKLIFPFFFSIFWATKQRVDVAATEEGPNSHSMC